MAGGWSFPAKPQPALAQAWQDLASPGPASSGRPWQAQALAGSGRLCQALAGLAGALAGSGRLWQALAGSGRLWQALAGSGHSVFCRV